ncbi:Gfo/Idh/MocA family protein [Ferruginibacter albus]|uniref:Gfo/Idh/MocA family protein n=1 Tax=Ferruginibacter albus TaxID=2875540 RepID=UPI001CC504BB|nr:Gfo/Idh/MocA family oxidoreductase [Ferruginibacter albus]UAY50681.1 Gfo/Idh/MocA family oxidoreductase [Ferruginibacter albus]
MALNFGILGCGRIAQRHALQISQVGKLIAVCDIVEEKAMTIGNSYNAKIYTSDIELLKTHPEIDIIVVCTPNGLHAKQSIAALKAGFHVICEKPMAIKVKDCEEMITVAESMNKKLFIVKQNRFNPPVEAVKKILDEGRLGKLFSIQLNCFWNRNDEYYKDSWKGSIEMDGGTLYTQFSHFIDLLYWMIGDIKNVNAFAKNYNHNDIIEFEDAGVVILEFENGAIGTINYTINSFQKNMEGSLTIFGEKGTVKIGGEYLNELEYQNIDNYKITDLPQGNPPNNYGKYVGSMSNHDKVYAHVADILTNNSNAKTNSYEALKTVEIIQKIYKAAKNN